jgi:hypothetical protein
MKLAPTLQSALSPLALPLHAAGQYRVGAEYPEELKKLIASGQHEVTYKPDGSINVKPCSATVPPSDTVQITSIVTTTQSSIQQAIVQESEVAYREAEQATNELYKHLKKYKGLTLKPLETTWKTGLVLGGLGSTVVISALVFKLLIDELKKSDKKDDQAAYKKLKNFQWPVLIAADIYGLLFFKKAAEAWKRPLLKELANGNSDILQHLAEHGLVIPQLLTMLEQNKQLLTETKQPEQRFSADAYALMTEKARWATRLFNFLIESQLKNLASSKLNLKSDNLSLVSLAKKESLEKLNITKHIKEPPVELPWYEQVVHLLQAPLDYTIGYFTGERLLPVTELTALYEQAWQQHLATGSTQDNTKYLSQVMGEITTRTSSNYATGIIPPEATVALSIQQEQPALLITTPTTGMPLIANQSIRNGAGLGNKPLPSPAENPYSVPEKLNMFSAAWHSWWRAILPPEQK